VTGAEGDTARAWLRLAWGDRAEVETDANGDLTVIIDLPDGRLSATVASLHCPVLLMITS
jgi:hypothetical protein